MNRMKSIAAVAALVPLSLTGQTTIAAAQDGLASQLEASVLGGIQVLNENDTALQDRFINVPAVAALTYHVTPIFAVEGEFTWMIPVEQSVSLGSGSSQDRKTPDILAYQANLRAEWPTSADLTPYLAAGAGAVTILSNTEVDRLPQIEESQTMFALNFGAGASYGLGTHWALRADFRQFVAFPSEDAEGLSDESGADEIWMERGTLGVAYRF